MTMFGSDIIYIDFYVPKIRKSSYQSVYKQPIDDLLANTF